MLSLLLGGAGFGLLGSVITQIFKIGDRFMQAKEDASKRVHEVALLQMNIDARGQEMENEAMIAQAGAMADMLSASYKHDASYGPVGPKSAAVLRFVRPAMTFVLFAIVTAMYFTIGDTQLDPESGLTIKESLVLSVLGMMEIVVTWWFADRGINKMLKRQ